MSKSMNILFFTMMLLGCATTDDSGLYTDTGLSFTEIGSLHVSGQRLIIRAHFSMQQYFDEMGSMKSLLKQITESEDFKKLMSLEHLPENDPNNTIKIARTLNVNLQNLIQLVDLQGRSFNEFLSTLKLSNPNRDRRGLLTVAGDALKFLFGTATESDTDKINDMIEILSDNQKNLKNQINLHTLTIKHSINDLIELEKRTRVIRNHILLFYSKLQQIQNSSNKIETLLYMEILTSQIQTTLLHLESTMNKLERALFNAYNGIVEPFLFTPKSALEILKKLSESLDLSLPFPAHEKWLPKFYDIITILPYRDSKMTFLFLIIVPLLSHPSVFSLYEVKSLPVPVNNSLVLQIKHDDSYLAEVLL